MFSRPIARTHEKFPFSPATGPPPLFQRVLIVMGMVTVGRSGMGGGFAACALFLLAAWGTCGAEGYGAWEELEALAHVAPGREIGQPGNAEVDRWVKKRFAAAVARNDGLEGFQYPGADIGQTGGVWERYLEAVDAAQFEPGVFGRDHSRMEALSGAGTLLLNYLEVNPWPALLLWVVCVALLLGAYWLQRRMSLLVVAAVFLAGGTAIAAMMLGGGRGAGGMEGARVENERLLTETGAELLHAEAKIAAALEGRWQHGSVRYPTAAFVPGEAWLEAAGARVRVYQLAPNFVEPGNLPDDGFHGRLVYVGRGGHGELRDVDLDGAFALMEFNSENRWLDAVELGASGVVFVEPEESTGMIFREAETKMSVAPVSVPRFHLPRRALAELLGGGMELFPADGLEIRLSQAPGVWERLEVDADWLFIPAAPESLREQPRRARELVHIQAFKDARSIVPELSPGASGAANLILLDRLVRHFEKHPPARPVLFSVVNDLNNALNGPQNFATAAFANPGAMVEEFERLTFLYARQRFTADIFRREPSAPLLEYLRDAIEHIGGRVMAVKDPVVDELMMRRNNLRAEQNQLRFALTELPGGTADVPRREEAQALEERLRLAGREADQVIELLGLFNRFGHRTEYDALDNAALERLRELFSGVAERAEKQAELLRADRRRLLDNLALRRRLSGLNGAAQAGPVETEGALLRALHPELPALAAFVLELDFDTPAMGFFHRGNLRIPIGPPARAYRAMGERSVRLARLCHVVAADLAEETGVADPLRSTILGAGGLPWEAHAPRDRVFGAYSFHVFDRPALSLAGVGGMRSRVFTPDDTLQYLNRAHFQSNMAFAEALLPRLVNAPELTGTWIARPNPDPPFSMELTVRQQDTFSVEIPKTLVPGALVAGYLYQVPPLRPVRTIGEMRPWPVMLADPAGRLTVRGNLWREASIQAFAYDPAFREVRAAIDFGDNERRFRSTLLMPARSGFAYRSLVAFEAAKTDFIGLTEPVSLQALREVAVLDGRNDTAPRHYAVSGVEATGSSKRLPLALDGAASVFYHPGEPFKLRSGNTLLLNTTPADPSGAGILAGVGLVRDAAMISARDFESLATRRLDLLRGRGVVSDTADEFAGEAAVLLGELDGPDLSAAGRLRLAEIARGLAFQAYERSVSISNDLVRAVVVLLGLVVPFCFFLMKLVTPFTDANRQLLLFMGIFALMVLGLYLVQPAFRVGDRPEVIILAFLILGLAVFVATTIMGRFNAAMAKTVDENQLADGLDGPQGRLASTAFMVGVNNMKRRRIRTTLTCVTIMLVTFTLLSVISVSQDAEPLRLRLGGDVPYTGLLFTSPGFAPIEEKQFRRLREHFEERGETLARTWTYRQDRETGVYLPYFITRADSSADGASPEISARAVLGLETAEDGFLTGLSGPQSMLPGGRWFSSNNAREIILSRRAAILLGLDPENARGETLLLAGEELELAGVLNDEMLEELQDLRGFPVLPVLGMGDTMPGETQDLTAAVDMAGGPGVSAARPLDVAIVPVETARSLGNTAYHSLSVRYSPLPSVDPAAAGHRLFEDISRFLRYQSAYVAAGFEVPVERDSGQTMGAGEYIMASATTARVGGTLKIAIPVALAATIILNTMLGAVMERRREISIYNSIGLNPTHVMFFFLAESLVFGLVGSVAGYFIGQSLSVVFSHFMDINLNYSSLSVMLVIFLAIATVMISTLYPARLAAKAAVPSGQHRWSLPIPEGDEIHLRFPFSYDASRVPGVCAYLHEFMEQNSEASTGAFLARLAALGKVPSGRSDEPAQTDATAYVLAYIVAPVPFDLGINQRMEIYADYDPEIRAHVFTVYLACLTGDRDNWLSVNQRFLEAMRKRLLAWRSLQTATQAEYCRRGVEMFVQAATLPVRPGGRMQSMTTPVGAGGAS